ncbi:MAG: efflux RND transporter periplasmic adaptor subunit, partial [Armatimonadota bacterium]
RLIMVFIVLAVVVGGFLTWKALSPKKSKGGTLRTEQVKRGEIIQKISSTGIVSAQTGGQVKIGSQITGRIKRLNADVGDQVTAGQVIAELDAPDLSANLAAALRSAAQAETKYQQQLTGVSMQRTQTSSAFEQASAALASAQARAAQARTSLTASQSRVRSAQSGVTGALAGVRSAEAKLRSAQAASTQQATQGNTDIISAKAALSTAQANLVQTQKSSDTLVANAVTSLKQAQATAALATINLKRQENLLTKGYVAQSDVDTAQTNRDNTAQIVEAAQNSLDASRAQATAQVQAARNAADQARANLTAAEASSFTNTIRTESVRAAEADLASAKENAQQATLAVDTAKDDVTNARSTVNSADADVRSALAAQRTSLGNLTQDKLKQQDVKTAYEAMQQSRAQVAYQQAQFDKSNIRTPISGTVISLTQQQGETVAAGLSAPQLVEVAALDRMEVIAYVDETDIGKVKLGQEAEVTVDAYPKEKFAGRIYKISSAATMQQNVVTYACSVRLDSYKTGLLKPQMTADVQIILSKAMNLLLAPNEALKQSKGGTQVVVLTAGKGEVKSITTGRTDGSFTEVTEGLKEGDTLVLAGFSELGI